MSTQPYQRQDSPRAAARTFVNHARAVSRVLLSNHTRAVSRCLIANHSRAVASAERA